LTFTKAGTYTLTAAPSGLASGTSATITVNAAAASQMVFAQQPRNAKPHFSIGTVIVNVEDAFGNLATSDTSTVTVSSTSAINGTTSVAAVAGVATFTGLSVTPAGTFALAATDSALTPATSNPFNITVPLSIINSNGSIAITGNTSSDTIAGGTNPADSSQYYFLIQAPGLPMIEQFFAKTAVTAVTVLCDPSNTNTGPGDNDLVNLAGTDFGFTVSIQGGGGSDTIMGQLGANDITTGANSSGNQIFGSIGADSIQSLGSNDTVHSDGGADTIRAHAGNNVLTGGRDGSDLIAGSGWDTLRSERGNATLHGSQNTSSGTLMLGGAGNDLLDGTGSSNDTMIAGNGLETLIAGTGTSFMDAGWDSYLILRGGATLPGSTGGDSISGATGALDTIVSSGGAPTLVGSATANVWDLNNPSANTSNVQTGDFVAQNDTVNPSGATTITVHLSIAIDNGTTTTNVLILTGAGATPTGTSSARATDGSGTVVFQTHAARTFTLADFFNHWGVAFNSRGVGQFIASPGSSASLSMTVNGAANTQFQNYQVQDGDTIAITFAQ
jgi:hypothetical protein